MRLQVLGWLVAGLHLLAPPVRADVRIVMADGNVTMSAKDATIAQILAEWARVGQTRMVNVERLSGPPMSFELTSVPEAQALDTILRSVGGYLAAPRPVPLPNASQYDRVFVLPASTTSAPRIVTAPVSAPPTFAAPPIFLQPDERADEAPAVGNNGGPQIGQPNGPRGPVFVSSAPPPPQQPQPVQRPSASPTFAPAGAPVGVSTPGMVVPTPPQPGQAGDPR
jgi:hypothetical protein